MSILSNSKWERFAQGIAKGATATDAYVAAGYSEKGASVSASRLRGNAKVEARISELLLTREHIAAQSIAKAIEKTALSKEYVISRLMENLDRAMQHEAARNEAGEPIGAFRYDGAVANKTLELLGKEIGMFIDRSETRAVVHTISSDPLSPDEWISEHGGLTAH